ncbi:hypothetical protein KOW79_019805 [Hemibagrus wyckioides]|uniref:Ig-like domain-containing protein n=1 Tax=Hemibagrus wyckioides TaxID=337641 RepID=A0A9D3SES8_9TELE|nr:uncharacterized protein LOC131345777 [Hemibagrus wyckioides]KAG7316264.1 hypothetical protein KOW79_019805 [Hemibagrus wyckioides]
MTTLFVALCVLFSLFTAVKSSDIKELHVRTVKSGEDVTIECNIGSLTKKDQLVWYRQSSGNVPRFFGKPYHNAFGYKFAPGFNDSRFSISVTDHKFKLSINKIREDDVGEYFCGEIEGSVLKFTSGTHLQFEDEERMHYPTSGTTTSDSTSSNKKGEDYWIIPLAVSNIISVIVITVLVGVLYKNHRKDSSSSNHQIPTNQAADDDVLNYAAVSFAKKPSSSRTFREKSHEDVYTRVKIK